MLDLAISTGADPGSVSVIETNHGVRLRASGWPQDSDFQLVAFSPTGENCEVVWTESLAEDIGYALVSLDRAGALKGRKPDWYRRLKRYAKGVSSA
jgi:hypothetical protein